MANHENRVKIRGTWDSKTQSILFKKPYSQHGCSTINLLIDPCLQENVLNIKNKHKVTVYGCIHKTPSTVNSHLLVNKIIDHQSKTGFKDSCRGIIEVDATNWHFIQNTEISLLQGVCNDNPIYISMPLIYSRWAKTNSKYLIGSRLSFLVDDFSGYISASTNNFVVFPFGSTIISSISKEELNKPKLLPANQAGMVYELNKTSTVSHIKTRKVSPKLRREVFARDAWTCQECGASPEKTKDVFLEVDHIIPFSRGGTNHINNLQTLCSVCNAAKSDGKPKHLILQTQSA